MDRELKKVIESGIKRLVEQLVELGVERPMERKALRDRGGE